MRTCIGLALVTLTACAAHPAAPVTVVEMPAPKVLPPGDAAEPVVVVGSEQITIDGKPVGSVRAIDRLGRLQKIDELFEALKERRAAWKAAHEGEAFAGVAALEVAPGTSGRAFASAYQTIAFAGYPRIRVAVGGRYHETSAQVPGPPCGAATNPCPRKVLRVQVDERLWRLRVPREGGPIEESGEGPRSTLEGFRSAASGVVSSAGVEGIVIHVAPDVSFARLAPFLAEVVELARRATLAEGVTVSVRGLDTVQAVARVDGSTVSGRLAPEHIQKVVRSRFDRLRKCYEAALVRDAGAAGKTTTRFVIGRDGTVPEARTTLSGSLPPDMSACMEAVFGSLTFDAPQGGIVTVTYPIVFSPNE